MGKDKDLEHFLTIKNAIILDYIKEFTRSKQKQKNLFEKFCSCGKFIQLGNPTVFSKTQFISKELILKETLKTGISLLSYYKTSLKNLKAKNFKNIFKIKKNKFFGQFNNLFVYPLTLKDKNKLIQFLSEYGLIDKDEKSYLDFSNFKLLSKVDEKYLEIFTDIFINTVCYSPRKNIGLQEKFELSFNKFLSNFIKNSRTKNIIKFHFGFSVVKKLSLNEIGTKYNISGERVEQILNSCLKKLSFNKDKIENQQLTLGLEINLRDKIYYELLKLATILIAIIFRSSRKVYINDLPELFSKITFIFKLLNIPIYKISKINIYIFGITKETGKKIDSLITKHDNNSYREIIDITSLKNYINSIKGLHLSSKEIEKLTCKINEYLKEITITREIIYVAFKKIGRPAHYNEIAKICSTIFKDRIFTPEQIHRCLTFKSNQPWVWIGIRGVYALKEWDFTRPDKGLNKTVFEIVDIKFNETGNPVPLSYIFKEIGNYRKVVNENSLFFACNFNPKITVLQKDFFIPSSKNAMMDIKDNIKSNKGNKFFYDTVNKPSKKDTEFLNELDTKFRKYD